MDFVRMRHGNAVWHRVTGREEYTHEFPDGYTIDLTYYYTVCVPTGYCANGPRTEVVTAEHPPGRLCRRCAKGMGVAA